MEIICFPTLLQGRRRPKMMASVFLKNSQQAETCDPTQMMRVTVVW